MNEKLLKFLVSSLGFILLCAILFFFIFCLSGCTSAKASNTGYIYKTKLISTCVGCMSGNNEWILTQWRDGKMTEYRVIDEENFDHMIDLFHARLSTE